MPKPGGTNISPGLIQRALQGARYALTGNSDWFGPGKPQPPTAPETIEGRQFEFPISVNTINSTKVEGVSFADLRRFADACDIVRLLIETRKDQICGLSWVIKDKAAENKSGLAKRAPSKKSITDVTDFLQSPDKDHSWAEWLRFLLEDMFVLDAPCMYIQRTNKGDVYALRPIDGGTIKRIIDTHGWAPAAPDPAYQQILQGTVALSYSADEMVYKPRNPRTNRIYGYGPVEQTIITAKQWLLRQASNLEYYETGNMPEGFLTGAEGWTPEQLRQFQNILDAMLSGNLAERRKVRVVPSSSKYTPAKEPALKNDFDEWLARIACFAFSYPPTPFIRQLNRSTSDSSKQSSDEEGVTPITRWVKELLDGIIQTRLGYADLEFVFQDKEAQDPLERAQIDQIYVNCGVLTANEIRADMGRDPLPEPEENAPVLTTLDAPVGAQEAAGGEQTPNADSVPPKAPIAAVAVVADKKKVAAKLGKAASEGADLGGGVEQIPGDSIDRNRPVVAAARTKLETAIAAALDLAQESATEQVTAAIDAGQSLAQVSAAIDAMTFDGLEQAEPELQAALTEVASAGAQAGMTEVGIAVDMSQVSETAVAWAKARAASLITSDGAGGELLDATRDLIRGDVTTAIEEGWTNAKLAKTLRENYAFSRSRALTIARTEISKADNQGNLEYYIKAGIAGKRWLLAQHPCPVCQANAAQGAIPIAAEFSSGDQTPPAHPRCACVTIGEIDYKED